MSTKKVCMCGHFGFGETLLNGQTVKTKIITAELEKKLGENEISKIDTRGGVASLVRLPFVLIKALHNSENIVILPAENGLRVIAPLLVLFNTFYKRKLHYTVIGGWLAGFIKNKKFLAKQLKKFNFIYVETNKMKQDLEEAGFENITVMPNFKPLRILSEDELVYPKRVPYKLCTFSRVMREKGMEDAIAAVKAVNEKYGKTIYTLDIYGQVDENQTEWFEELKNTFPEYVSYGGLIPFNESVDIIKGCFALLFPTRFFTEGVPGTIIDAYAAGVPVISARWESFSDVIVDGETGFGYEFGNNEQLIEILDGISASPKELLDMKKVCLNAAADFLPENIIDVLERNL